MGGFRFTLNLKIWPSSFPYIFLLFDCFKWALIECIEKHRVHSVFWQFQTPVGSISRFTLNLPDLSSFQVLLLLHRSEWYRGVNQQIYPKSARFELVSSFSLASQSSFISINRNKRPMNIIPYIFWETPQMCVETLTTVLLFPRQLIWGITCLGLLKK